MAHATAPYSTAAYHSSTDKAAILELRVSSGLGGDLGINSFVCAHLTMDLSTIIQLEGSCPYQLVAVGTHSDIPLMPPVISVFTTN